MHVYGVQFFVKSQFIEICRRNVSLKKFKQLSSLSIRCQNKTQCRGKLFVRKQYNDNSSATMHSALNPWCVNFWYHNSIFRFHGRKYHYGAGVRQVFYQHGVQFNLRLLKRTLSNCCQVFCYPLTTINVVERSPPINKIPYCPLQLPQD